MAQDDAYWHAQATDETAEHVELVKICRGVVAVFGVVQGAVDSAEPQSSLGEPGHVVWLFENSMVRHAPYSLHAQIEDGYIRWTPCPEELTIVLDGAARPGRDRRSRPVHPGSSGYDTITCWSKERKNHAKILITSNPPPPTTSHDEGNQVSKREHVKVVLEVLKKLPLVPPVAAGIRQVMANEDGRRLAEHLEQISGSVAELDSTHLAALLEIQDSQEETLECLGRLAKEIRAILQSSSPPNVNDASSTVVKDQLVSIIVSIVDGPNQRRTLIEDYRGITEVEIRSTSTHDSVRQIVDNLFVQTRPRVEQFFNEVLIQKAPKLTPQLDELRDFVCELDSASGE